LRKSPPLLPLEQRLGYTFRNKELVQKALSHASATPDSNYERLEFLGDRVLGLALAHLLFDLFSQAPEGPLAKRHAYLVSEPILAQIGTTLGLDPFIIADLETRRPSLIADVLEALLAVIYLESGFEAASKVIYTLWMPLAQELVDVPLDPKTALQEWVHLHKLPLPTYEVLGKQGPDHAPLFEVQVSLDPQKRATAKGNSIREAEKLAAEILLKDLRP
jgi:ribonuclease-3